MSKELAGPVKCADGQPAVKAIAIDNSDAGTGVSVDQCAVASNDERPLLGASDALDADRRLSGRVGAGL